MEMGAAFGEVWIPNNNDLPQSEQARFRAEPVRCMEDDLVIAGDWWSGPRISASKIVYFRTGAWPKLEVPSQFR